ncbi:MAG: hypothetical protein IJW18_00455 [Lachnospiraceae bacterium]|nr:hypothetical protein [Lachnospiraceae bacterium]
MNPSTVKPPIKPVRGFFGFLLTLLLSVFVFITTIVIPINATYLKGSSVGDIIRNTGIYDFAMDIVKGELSGEYADVFKDVLNENDIANICDSLMDAVVSGDDIDLSYMQEDLVSSIEAIVNSTIDSALDEIKKGSNIIDAESLSKNKSLRDLEDTYNMDVTGMIIDKLESGYGVTSIDLNTYNAEEMVRKLLEKIMENDIHPFIESEVAVALDNASDEINSSLGSDSELKPAFGMLDLAMSLVDFAIVLLCIFIAAFIIIQIAMYHSCMYRACRNVSLSTFIPGIIITLSAIISKFILTGILVEALASTEIANYSDSVTEIVSPLFTSLLIGGLISLAVAILFFILSLSFKTGYEKKLYSANGNRTVYLSANTAKATSAASRAVAPGVAPNVAPGISPNATAANVAPMPNATAANVTPMQNVTATNVTPMQNVAPVTAPTPTVAQAAPATTPIYTPNPMVQTTQASQAPVTSAQVVTPAVQMPQAPVAPVSVATPAAQMPQAPVTSAPVATPVAQAPQPTSADSTSAVTSQEATLSEDTTTETTTSTEL